MSRPNRYSPKDHKPYPRKPPLAERTPAPARKALTPQRRARIVAWRKKIGR